MILLDPDLEPPPAGAPVSARKTSLKKRSSLPEPEKARNRVPTARTLGRFLADAQGAVKLRGEVNVLLTTDVAIRRLNRQFRGMNKATDVLSFPAFEAMAGDVAGDLAISIETARRQALEQGHPLAKEIKVLILHGLLHLAGYDHETDSGQMARRERLLRHRLGLPEGLIERADSSVSKQESAAKPAPRKVSSGRLAAGTRPASVIVERGKP